MEHFVKNQMIRRRVTMKKLIFLGVMMIFIVSSTVACVYVLGGSDDILSTDEVLYEEMVRLHPIEENGLWGFMNMLTGERVIEPQFAWVGIYSKGLAFVRGVEGREYQTGYIDLAGNLVIPLPAVSEGHGFSEGFAFVRGIEGRDDLTGYIDMTGNLVIPLPAVSEGHGFSEGFAFVRGVEGRDDLTGYIDMTGNLIISLPSAIIAHEFSNGFAVVIEREWNYYDEAIVPIGVPGPFIFIDRAGQNAFGREFSTASSFRGDLAIVSLDNGNKMFMDTVGRNAFGREFLFIFSFDGDYAYVTLLNGAPARINIQSGRIVRK